MATDTGFGFVLFALLLAGFILTPITVYQAVELKKRRVEKKSPTACWKMPQDIDEHGRATRVQHVATFLRNASSDMLLATDMPVIPRVDGAAYDYPADTQLLLQRMAQVNTPQQHDEIRFFDAKLNLALGMIASLLLEYGQSVEEIILHSFGESTTTFDSGVVVWKSKLLNSRIRPQSVVQQLYPDERLTINDGVEVWGRHFQSLIRVMPHSEFPSASACLCQAIKDYTHGLWPELSLSQQGVPVPFTSNTRVIVGSDRLPLIPILGTPNPSVSGYTAHSLAERCAATRLDAGLHFPPSVQEGQQLCAEVGGTVAFRMLQLLPPITLGGTSIRAVLQHTPPCADSCCADEAACSAVAQAACSAQCTGTWDLPWFDVVDARKDVLQLPDRSTAADPLGPFIQVDRQHLLVVSVFGALAPEISTAETIFQLRYTNTVDQLMWHSIAANSASFLVLRLGPGQQPGAPLVRSGYTSTDARVATAVHAVAAALPLLLPSTREAFEASLAASTLSPSIGFLLDLTDACGRPECPSTVLSPVCLQSWYSSAPGPARLGQVVAYEVMYQRSRDGWNSLGTAGGCDAGAYFCPAFRDAGAEPWDPEAGICRKESLQAR